MRFSGLIGSLGVLLLPAAGSAEYLVFLDGRTLKVTSYRFESGDTLVDLKGGGSMRFGSEVVSHVAPDEDVEEARAPAVTAASDLPPGADWKSFADSRFVEPIEKHARLFALEPALVAAVIKVESNFHPRAVSPKGARGLMQLMPDTAREVGVADPFDAEANIGGGTSYLSGLLKRYKGDLKLALAAYNAGPTAVDRAQGVPAYAETRRYVERVLGFAVRAGVVLD